MKKARLLSNTAEVRTYALSIKHCWGRCQAFFFPPARRTLWIALIREERGLPLSDNPWPEEQ